MFAPNAHDAFKQPDWRWERARWLRENGKFARYGCEDSGVVIAHQFQSKEAACRTAADRENLIAKYPGIHFAKEIHRRPDRTVRWAVEAYLLSGAARTDIAMWMATSVDTVLWYGKLFYDVAPYLNADSYIMNVVIGNQAIHDRDIGTLWKVAGYTRGGLFLREMIRTMQVNHVTDVADLPKAWETWFAETLSRRAAVTMTTMPSYGNEVVILDARHRTRELAQDQDGATAESVIAANLSAALSAMPFSVGRERPTSIPALAKYDESPVELRAHEEMQIAMGFENESHRQMLTMKFPEPKERPSDDRIHGGATGSP